jgi:hypothetical protein
MRGLERRDRRSPSDLDRLSGGARFVDRHEHELLIGMRLIGMRAAATTSLTSLTSLPAPLPIT